MSVSSPRNRLVYFRVSKDEYELLENACSQESSARSISDLARQAVIHHIGPKQVSPLEQKVDALNQVVLDLKTTLLQFQKTLEKKSQGIKKRNSKHNESKTTMERAKADSQ